MFRKRSIPLAQMPPPAHILGALIRLILGVLSKLAIRILDLRMSSPSLQHPHVPSSSLEPDDTGEEMRLTCRSA